jgi:hypothetical protein
MVVQIREVVLELPMRGREKISGYLDQCFE